MNMFIMIQLHTALTTAVSAFFAILFLQSGIDKVTDRKGNFEFHTSHFANSPLRKIVPLMLVVITVMELCCGILFAAGLLFVLMKGDSAISFYGSCLAAVILIFLFLGQRITKDYKGAASLVPYFILSLMAMYISFS
jgi:uncharacterized membrane protein YphA (DoxX/SURF4 family)